MKPETCYTCRFKTTFLESHPKADGTFAWLCYRCWGEYNWTALVIEPEDYVSTPEKLREREDYEAKCITNLPVETAVVRVVAPQPPTKTTNPGICYTCRLKTSRLQTFLHTNGSAAWLCFICWLLAPEGVIEPEDYVSTPEDLRVREEHEERCDAKDLNKRIGAVNKPS